MNAGGFWILMLMLAINGGCAFQPAPSSSSLTASTTTTTASVKPSQQPKTAAEPAFEIDRRVLHVGNLDFSIPVDECVGMLRDIMLLWSHDDSFTIRIKPKTLRRRDIDKQHGGSATITFVTNELAAAAYSVVQKNPVVDQQNWKIRYAMVNKEKEKNSNSRSNTHDDDATTETTTTTTLTRSARTEQYLRRRRRIAAQTDALLDRIQIVVPSVDSQQQQQQQQQSSPPLQVLRVPALDWTTIPAPVDPVRGGKLLSSSSRAQRKRAAVEAFVVAVAALLRANNHSTINSSNNSHGVPEACWIADLGCGAGNLALPLAWWMQQQQQQQQQQKHSHTSSMRILGIDLNEKALQRLDERVLQLSLIRNDDNGTSTTSSSAPLVITLQHDILDLIVPGSKEADLFVPTNINPNDMSCSKYNDILSRCSAVVALHACGAASDLAILAAVQHGLPFAVSPCCIGKVNAVRTSPTTNMPQQPVLSTVLRSAAPSHLITYPRSQWLQNQNITTADFQLLAKAADYGASTTILSTTTPDTMTLDEQPRRHRARRAREIVERDRLEWARERGYRVRLVALPHSHHDHPQQRRELLLLGAVHDSPAAARISTLAVEDHEDEAW